MSLCGVRAALLGLLALGAAVTLAPAALAQVGRDSLPGLPRVGADREGARPGAERDTVARREPGLGAETPAPRPGDLGRPTPGVPAVGPAAPDTAGAIGGRAGAAETEGAADTEDAADREGAAPLQPKPPGRAGGGVVDRPPAAPGAAEPGAPAAAPAAAETGGSLARTDTMLPLPEKEPVHEYRLGAVGSSFTWDEDAGAEHGLLAGFDVERDISSFLAVRAGLGYGNTDFSLAADGGTGEGEPTDVRIYLPELSILLQPRFGALAGAAVVPYAILGFGSLITDPDRTGVSTRSQNAFGYGGGARLEMNGRLGVKGEVERYLIKLEDPFAIEERDSRAIHNTRFSGSVTYSF